MWYWQQDEEKSYFIAREEYDTPTHPPKPTFFSIYVFNI